MCHSDCWTSKAVNLALFDFVVLRLCMGARVVFSMDFLDKQISTYYYLGIAGFRVYFWDFVAVVYLFSLK